MAAPPCVEPSPVAAAAAVSQPHAAAAVLRLRPQPLPLQGLFLRWLLPLPCLRSRPPPAAPAGHSGLPLMLGRWRSLMLGPPRQFLLLLLLRLRLYVSVAAAVCAPRRDRPTACCLASWAQVCRGHLALAITWDQRALRAVPPGRWSCHLQSRRGTRGQGLGERAPAAAWAGTSQGPAAGLLCCKGGVPAPPSRGAGAPLAAEGSSRSSKMQQWRRTQ